MYVYETADNAEYDLLRAFADYNKRYPTDAERIIWDLIRNNQLGIKFRRQHVIDDYIADGNCLCHVISCAVSDNTILGIVKPISVHFQIADMIVRIIVGVIVEHKGSLCA